MNADADNERLADAKPPKAITAHSTYKVQRNIEDVTHELVPTASVLPCPGDRHIIFKIEPSSKLYTNISILKCRIQFNIRDKNGSAPPQDAQRQQTFVPGAFQFAAFRDVRISCNGKVISESEGLNSFVGPYLGLTRLSRQTKALLRQTALFYDNDITVVGSVEGADGKKTISLSASNWEDLGKRLDLFSVDYRFPVDISFYIVTDIGFDKTPCIIPSNCAIDVELSFNNPARFIINTKPDAGDIQPFVNITLAELCVTRILPSSTVRRSLKQEFYKVRATPLIVPADSTVYRNQISYATSVLPSRLVLRFVKMSSFDGRFQDNQNASYHYNIQSVVFNVGGRRYPSSPITADFSREMIADMFLRSSEAMRFSLSQTGSSIGTLQDYQGGGFIFAQDISADYSSGSSWSDRKEKGWVGVELVFASPTPEPIIALIISEVPACLSINNDSEVLLD